MFVTGSVATIRVVPAATAVARPSEPALLLMVATLVCDELQFTDDPIFGSGEPSARVPIAVNNTCVVVPREMIRLAGATSMDTSGVSMTVTVTLQVIDGLALSIAVITAGPALTVETSPLLLTVATVVSDDCHVTCDQNSNASPSEKCAVTKSCRIVNLTMNRFPGVMLIDVMVFFFPQPLKPTAARDKSDTIRTRAIVRRFI